jgi:hypothetical protein
MDSMWNVDVGLVEPWLLGLDQDSYEQVVAALELLAERGPQLGRPLVDTVVRSRHKNMKELRPGSSGRSELRILFALIRSGGRSCLSRGTMRATGASGTRRTFRLLMTCSMII